MSDYAGQAASIYDPQLAADTAAVDQQLNTTLSSLDSEQGQVNPYYDAAAQKVGLTRKQNDDQADFVANTHGLWSSGLISNQHRLIGEDYSKNTTAIEQARAAKLGDIASRRSVAQTNAASSRAALASKYSGMKAAYIAQQQQHDADVAAQERIATRSAAAYSRGGGGGGGSSSGGGTRDMYNNDLSSIESALRAYRASGYKGQAPGSRGSTANELISKYSGTVSPQEINAYTKQLFGRYGIG